MGRRATLMLERQHADGSLEIIGELVAGGALLADALDAGHLLEGASPRWLALAREAHHGEVASEESLALARAWAKDGALRRLLDDVDPETDVLHLHTTEDHGLQELEARLVDEGRLVALGAMKPSIARESHSAILHALARCLGVEVTHVRECWHPSCHDELLVQRGWSVVCDNDLFFRYEGVEHRVRLSFDHWIDSGFTIRIAEILGVHRGMRLHPLAGTCGAVRATDDEARRWFLDEGLEIVPFVEAR